jgi:hypothetical protein
LVFHNSEEANKRSMPSQMKHNARSESGLAWARRSFLREFFRTSANLVKRSQERCYREKGVVVAACLLANAFGVLSRIILGPAHARGDTRVYTIAPAREEHATRGRYGRSRPDKANLASSAPGPRELDFRGRIPIFVSSFHHCAIGDRKTRAATRSLESLHPVTKDKVLIAANEEMQMVRHDHVTT